MKISGYGSIGSSNNIKKRGETAQTGAFSDVLAAAEGEETAPASQARDVASTAALSNLLVLQEVSEEEIRRDKLLKQGKGLLDTLDELRQKLLTGNLPPQVIRKLTQQLSVQKQFIVDDKLNEIIDDIELRAAVELAKLEMATKNQQQQ